MSSERLLSHRLEEALAAVEHDLLGAVRVLVLEVQLEGGALDGGVGAVGALVLLVPRVGHSVTPQAVVVRRPVVAEVAAVGPLACVAAEVQTEGRLVCG